MINISKIIESWEKDGDWRVSPGADWCAAGNRVMCGPYAIIGNGARIGNCASIGDYATHLHDVGFADGHLKSLCAVEGVAYIGAGCRWFTLDQAIKHWSTHKEDRRATMCLMESAKALAKMYGLATGSE
jgi:hypothetical protein